MPGKLKEKVKIIIFLSLALIFLFSSSVSAQERQLEVEYPEIGGIKPEIVTTGLPEYVKYVFNFAVAFFGVVVFGVLLWAGLLYLTSIGNPAKMKMATDRIVSASLGLIILFSSYIALTTINPHLVIFPFPPLVPPAKVEAPKLPPIKPGEINLIATELPLGQSIENGLWQKERRTEIENLVKNDEKFLTEEIKIDDKKFDRIAGLNKYLKALTEDCRCGELKGLCTKPKDFSQPVGCSGDPCPKETREKINKILEINRGKIKKLLEFQKDIIAKKTDLENQLSIFQGIEQEMLSCETQQKQLFDLNEHLSRLNFFNEQGWKVDTVTVPGAPKAQADPLTFYCSVGGNIFDYPYVAPKEPPLEFTVPELFTTETPEELAESAKISCPAEIPLGEVIDDLREIAILLITRLEKLANLHQDMAAKIEEMEELVSQCNDTRCDIDCSCVPNPCYLQCCPGPCCYPNPCFVCNRFCKSPCLQTPGGCYGVPCPREKIAETVDEIKKIEEEILNNTSGVIKEIKQIFPQVSSLLADEANPKNLKNLRAGMNICFSPNVEEPTWALLDCATAVNNYGPTDQIIGACHPRNFFCCSLSEEKIRFPWQAPVSKEPAVSLPAQKFTPLVSEQGCPQGWLCDADVKNFNQYKDSSQSLKELISCMRTQLDRIQKEEKLTGTIGRISSISDSKLYPPQQTCSWEGGPIDPANPRDCSHLYYVRYKLEVVSAHYGGPACRLEHKSYAFDLGDEESAEYLIKAAKQCRPDVYVNFRTPGHYDHIHIGIGQAEGCGSN